MWKPFRGDVLPRYQREFRKAKIEQAMLRMDELVREYRLEQRAKKESTVADSRELARRPRMVSGLPDTRPRRPPMVAPPPMPEPFGPVMYAGASETVSAMKLARSSTPDAPTHARKAASSAPRLVSPRAPCVSPAASVKARKALRRMAC